MAVLEVNQMWSNQAWDVESLEGLRKKGSVTQVYQVVVEPTTTEVELSASTLLPPTGSSFNGAPYLFLKNRSFTRVSPVMWHATMKYDGEFGPNGATDPPWFAPAKISWSDTESDEAIDQDLDGKPIVNTNNERIEGVTMKIADLVLNVEKNYQSFSPGATHEYRHSVNSDTFYGFPAGTGRMIRFTAKQQFDADTGGYWAVAASIQFRYPYNTTPEKAWYARVLNEGFMVRSTAGDAPEKAYHEVDGRKQYVTKPVLLKENGTRETDRDNAHWLEFKRYQPLPYNSLGLQ